MSDIHIRDYLQADFKKGLAECLRALTDCPDESDRWPYLAAERSKRGIRTLVAVLDQDGRQHVVGTLSVFFEPKFIHGGSWAAHIEDVAVHPLHQGKGIGRLLVEYALEMCRARGCYKVILDCDSEVAAFYEKSGFYRNGICMRLDPPGA